MAEGTSFDAEEEFAGLNFHSLRLEQRFIKTMGIFYRQPDKSIREAGKNRAEAKAIYQMPGNDAFDREEIIKARREAALRRMADRGGTVLAVQDTTGVNYNTHLKTGGIGYISDKTIGVNIHSCLAVTAGGPVWGYWTSQVITGPKRRTEQPATRVRKHVR